MTFLQWLLLLLCSIIISSIILQFGRFIYNKIRFKLLIRKYKNIILEMHDVFRQYKPKIKNNNPEHYLPLKRFMYILRNSKRQALENVYINLIEYTIELDIDILNDKRPFSMYIDSIEAHLFNNPTAKMMTNLEELHKDFNNVYKNNNTKENQLMKTENIKNRLNMFWVKYITSIIITHHLSLMDDNVVKILDDPKTINIPYRTWSVNMTIYMINEKIKKKEKL